MGVAELQEAWEEYSPRVREDYGEWDEEREKAAVPHLEALHAFLAGETDLEEFKSKTDSLSKLMPFWGFRGNSQMFFNQLAKGGNQDDVAAALKQALPAPASVDDARDKLDQFQKAVEAARDHAESVGATQPGHRPSLRGRGAEQSRKFGSRPEPDGGSPATPERGAQHLYGTFQT